MIAGPEPKVYPLLIFRRTNSRNCTSYRKSDNIFWTRNPDFLFEFNSNHTSISLIIWDIRMWHTGTWTENVDHCCCCGSSNLSAFSPKFCSSPMLLRQPCCSPDLLLHNSRPCEPHSCLVSAIFSLQQILLKMAEMYFQSQIWGQI